MGGRRVGAILFCQSKSSVEYLYFKITNENLHGPKTFGYFKTAEPILFARKKTVPSKQEQNTTHNFENKMDLQSPECSQQNRPDVRIFGKITFWGPWKSSLWYHCPRDRFPRVEPSLRFHYLPCLTMSCWYLQKLTLSRHFYQSLTSYLLWQNKCNPHQTLKKLSAPSKKVVSKASGGHKSIIFRVNPKAQGTSPQLLHFILFILQGLDSPKAKCWLNASAWCHQNWGKWERGSSQDDFFEFFEVPLSPKKVVGFPAKVQPAAEMFEFQVRSLEGPVLPQRSRSWNHDFYTPVPQITAMDPKNDCFQWESPFPVVYFQVPWFFFGCVLLLLFLVILLKGLHHENQSHFAKLWPSPPPSSSSSSSSSSSNIHPMFFPYQTSFHPILSPHPPNPPNPRLHL